MVLPPVPLAAPLPTLRTIRLRSLACVAMVLHFKLRILVQATISRIRVLRSTGMLFRTTKALMAATMTDL